MTQLTIELPDSIYDHVQQLIAKENISIDQFVSLALGEKMSAIMTEDYLSQRAARGDRNKFLAILNSAPDVPPAEEDRIS